MQINNVEQMLQIQLMTQMLQQMGQSSGDSNTFQVALESMMKAMENSNTDLSTLGLGDLNNYSGSINNLSDSSSVSNDLKLTDTGIEDAVGKAAKKYNVDKSLIEAVIRQESSFNPNAKSSAGAMGLMQLMPGTAEAMGVDNPYNVEENVDGGTHYLRSLLDMYAGSKELALSAYNAGPGTLAARSVDSKDEISKLPNETKNYVSKVMKYYGK